MWITDTSCSGAWSESVLTRFALLLAVALAGLPAYAQPCGGTVRCEVEGGY